MRKLQMQCVSFAFKV